MRFMRRDCSMAEFRIETERLILRAWQEADIEPLFALRNDPRVMATLGPLQSREDVVQTFARQSKLQQSLGYCSWVIERRDTPGFIGSCGLQPGPEGTPLEGQIEIGWQLAHDVWGQGFAREAAQASLDWGFAHVPDDAIWAITATINTRSRGLMERLGMERHLALDFDHPKVPEGSPLKRHVTYSIGRTQ
jgi:RimJ/RimL family protein N-acetyltransferase